MAIRKSKWDSTPRIFGLTFLAFMIVIAGTFACSKAEEEAPEKGVKIEEGKVPFEGTIDVVYGKYIYVPEVQGFDIIIQGSLESGEISSLEGKEVKGEAHIDSERTSLLIADTIEVKEESGTYRNVFTRTEEVVLEDQFMSFVFKGNELSGADHLIQSGQSALDDLRRHPAAKQ